MALYNSKSKTVSIIIPTYNREKLIDRAIDSVLMQSYKDWELIIVDDGSNDETKKTLRTYLDGNESIQYHFHSNRGVAFSMNKGIELSTGEFITFLGSDDEYMESHLEVRVNYFNTHPKIDLVHSTAKIIGDQYVKDKNDLSKLIHLNECVLGGTLFGRRAVFKDLEGFSNVNYSPESDFLERAQKRFNITKISEPTYIYYRNTPSSICNMI